MHTSKATDSGAELQVTNRYQKDANNVSSKKLKCHDVSEPCCTIIHRIKQIIKMADLHQNNSDTVKHNSKSTFFFMTSDTMLTKLLKNQTFPTI